MVSLSIFHTPKKNKTTKNLDATLHSFSSYVFLWFGNEEINTHTKLNPPPQKKKNSSKKKQVGSKENIVDMENSMGILPFLGEPPMSFPEKIQQLDILQGAGLHLGDNSSPRHGASPVDGRSCHQQNQPSPPTTGVCP